MFLKSTSPSYPMAVSISRGALSCDDILISKKIMHLVVFDRSREDAARARALLQCVAGWKGVQVYAGGKFLQNPWIVSHILDCFLEATACSDWQAHCHKVIDDPFVKVVENRGFSMSIYLQIDKAQPPNLREAIQIGRYVFPCTLLLSQFHFQVDHPSKPEAQIQAGAVKIGCDWCPNFQPSSYKKIGERVVEKTVFT